MYDSVYTKPQKGVFIYEKDLHENPLLRRVCLVVYNLYTVFASRWLRLYIYGRHIPFAAGVVRRVLTLGPRRDCCRRCRRVLLFSPIPLQYVYECTALFRT